MIAKLRTIACVLSLLSCSREAPAVSAKEAPVPTKQPSGPGQPQDRAITLKETGVGQVAGCRVGVSNIWTEEFVDEAGQKRKAPRGGLSVFGSPPPHRDFSARVHAGQKVKIGGQTFLVSQVVEDPAHRGSIVLLPGSP